MWGLKMQPLKPEYRAIAEVAPFPDFKPHWFEPYIHGQHLTWQQSLIIRAIERALAGKAPLRITVESGHGTGKTTTIAMLLLWYLFCFKEAQIPCTAPTSEQMHDILWKEVKKWLDKMPKEIQVLYEWQTDYVRIKEKPETWFARAKTARKENTEALAGVHGDHVMLLVDEASGVPEEIFNTAEGSLTGDNILFVMISNHTRNMGFFHESHTKFKHKWQCISLNGEQSPIVKARYIQDIIDRHGIDSDEYRIRVIGIGPKEETIDTSGYVPLIVTTDMRGGPDGKFIGKPRMGIDPSGEGDDITAWVVRDQFKAKVVATEAISTPRSIAAKTITLMDYYGVKAEDVYIDNFGVGANVAQELALTQRRVNGINVGDPPDGERYENKRAEFSWRMREWLRQGGELIDLDQWDELKTVKYQRTLRDKIKIMSKKDMRKEGIKSPNRFDAMMLTFASTDTDKYERSARRVKVEYDRWGRPVVKELTNDDDWV